MPHGVFSLQSHTLKLWTTQWPPAWRPSDHSPHSKMITSPEARSLASVPRWAGGWGRFAGDTAPANPTFVSLCAHSHVYRTHKKQLLSYLVFCPRNRWSEFADRMVAWHNVMSAELMVICCLVCLHAHTLGLSHPIGSPTGISTDNDWCTFAPKIPFPETIQLRIRGFFCVQNSLRTCHYEAKFAKHYGSKQARHCGLIANGPSQANWDLYELLLCLLCISDRGHTFLTACTHEALYYHSLTTCWIAQCPITDNISEIWWPLTDHISKSDGPRQTKWRL